MVFLPSRRRNRETIRPAPASKIPPIVVLLIFSPLNSTTPKTRRRRRSRKNPFFFPLLAPNSNFRSKRRRRRRRRRGRRKIRRRRRRRRRRRGINIQTRHLLRLQIHPNPIHCLSRDPTPSFSLQKSQKLRCKRKPPLLHQKGSKTTKQPHNLLTQPLSTLPLPSALFQNDNFFHERDEGGGGGKRRGGKPQLKGFVEVSSTDITEAGSFFVSWEGGEKKIIKNKTKQNKTKQNKTKQNKTKQNKTKEKKRKEKKTKQKKTKQIKSNQIKTLTSIPQPIPQPPTQPPPRFPSIS